MSDFVLQTGIAVIGKQVRRTALGACCRFIAWLSYECEYTQLIPCTPTTSHAVKMRNFSQDRASDRVVTYLQSESGESEESEEREWGE